MIYHILSIVNVCAVQFIGSRESLTHNLQQYLVNNCTKPVVLESVSSLNFGKYTTAFEELRLFKPRRVRREAAKSYFQYSRCQDSGTATVILTRWLSGDAIFPSAESTLVASYVQTILSCMVALLENPKLIFIETKKSNLLTHNTDLEVDYLSVPVSSHIFLFTTAQLYLIKRPSLL